MIQAGGDSKRTPSVDGDAEGASREDYRDGDEESDVAKSRQNVVRKAPKVEADGRKRLVTVGRKQNGANCPKLIQDVRRLATTAATKSVRANCPNRSRVWPNNRDRNVTRKLRPRQTLPRGNRYRQAS